MVFAYLDALCCDGMFAEYLPAYANLEEMKEPLPPRRPGADGTCKKFLIQVLEETLAPIRAARARWEADIDSVYDLPARRHRARARTDGRDACARAAGPMRIDYFADRRIVGEWEALLRRQRGE